MWLMGRAAKPAATEAAPPTTAAPAAAPSEAAPAKAQPEATSAEPSGAAATSKVASSTASVTPAETEARNQAAATPTPEQAKHLLAILNGLQPDERKVARAVVQKMTADQRAHWLGELSLLTVENAVALVRSMIPTQAKKGEPT
jgi:hypothetical protein